LKCTKLRKIMGACWASTTKEKHEGKKGQLEGKEARERKACEVCMKGIPNDVRFRVFARYCNR
jgi:hypothetical protein